MNITELDNFNLADAVRFHRRLNPGIWGQDERMLPEVRTKLLEIAADFQEFLGISDIEVEDITISGSNAAYSYTPQSDIDLHLVVRKPEQHNDVYQELFNAKKYQYNDMHDIRVRGADVELYVQPADQTHVSLGQYSIVNNEWIQVPRRRRASIDHAVVKHKYEDLAARINNALKDDNSERIGALISKIKTMRQSGLDKHGEFGSENLAYKLLRAHGLIQKLYDAQAAARDRELSLNERRKKKKRVRYAYGGYWMPGFAFGDGEGGGDGGGGESVREDATLTPGGINPSTKMFLEDDANKSTLQKFVQYVISELGIDSVPRIMLHKNSQWSEHNHSFGSYNPESNTLHVSLPNRHILDVMRTVAHELVHCAQHESNPLPDHAGDTGSDWENEANAVAGVLMRDFAGQHPEIFQADQIDEAGILSFFNPAQQPKKKWDPARDSRVVSNHKDDNNWIKLLLDKHRRGISLTDREWYSLQQWQRQQIQKKNTAESSGYIPTKKQANDPRFKMALTKDIRPGATGKEANKLNLHTDSQGRPALLMKTANQMHEDLANDLRWEFALLEDEYLGEINMSTGSLRQEAAKTGAIAGMEFEMIVPNTENDEDGDLEPDYDQDERCRSIDDAVQFFYESDYNSRNDVERLRERMQNDFQEWLDDKIYRDWERGGEEFLEEWVPNNVDESEWNPDGLEGEPRQEALEEYISKLHADPGSSDAFDEFREDNYSSYDESDWLDAEDLDRMSGVQNAYDISWPYWTTVGGGEASIEDVADDFESHIGRTTRASGSYHSGRVQRPGPNALHYVVEPDGSLDGDNPGDTGLEFVSPPLPIDEILSDLNQVKTWAKEYGCYTNDSTGLHINISVPNYSRENLDFVKLALLMGDKYVLDLFGRASNTYAKSALDMVKSKVRNDPESAQQLLDKMKGNLDSLATKAIHSGVTSKYTSINTKDGHIEFRSPGGDWLDQNFDQIENTLLRFTVAMSAALNPAAYREEYLKKLYKLLTEDNKDDSDTIRYFSEYVAGKIPRAALRSFVKQAQLTRQVKRNKTGGKKMWWNVSNPGNSYASVEVVATTREEAIEKALGADGYPSWANTRQSIVAKPLRPYEEPAASAAQDTGNANSGNWGIWVSVLDRFAEMNVDGQSVTRRFRDRAAAQAWISDYNIRNPGNDLELAVQEIEPAAPEPQGVDTSVDYEIYNRETGEVVDTTQLRNDDEAQIRLDDYRSHGPHRLNRDQAERTFGIRRGPGVRNAQSRSTGRAATSPTGQWKIIDGLNREVYRFRPAVNTRATANELAALWARENNWDGNYQVEPAEEQASTPAAGSTADLAQQRATPGTFSGAWKIVDADGNELYRFSGIGNQQRDANRVATQWMQNNGYAYGTEMSVVPVMS